MIYVRDKGRLCNNILQYGHVYAWGREHGRQTVSMRFAYKYQFFRICHTQSSGCLISAPPKYFAHRTFISSGGFLLSNNAIC